MAKKPRIKATLGPFVLAYPYLTTPDTEGKYADNKYKTDAVEDAAYPKAIVQAKAALTDAAKQLGVNLKDVGPDNLPVKKEMEKDPNGGKKKVPTGKLLVRSKSQFAPAIVDAKGEPVAEKVLKNLKIGPGTIARLQGYFQDYEIKGEPGISFTLTGVQIIKLVQGGTGSADFDAYEDEDGGWSPDEAEGGWEPSDDSSDDQDSGDEGGLDI